MQHSNINDLESLFTNYLIKNSLKLTSQRKLIASEFFKSTDHLSAEDLYQRLLKVYPSIGQATVYRTMKIMRDAGVARELHFGDDVTRFEPKQTNHHDHLICEQCGLTLPVVDEQIEVQQTLLAQKHGFTLSRHRMYLYGLCLACQSPKPSKANN